MRNILLGVSASVACYKAAVLTRLLVQRGVGVRVMMTPTARRLVGAATFRALSGRPVLTDEWENPQNEDGMDHIAAVRAADALLVAPASADFIAKAASGIADNLLLAAFLAADCPRYVAPAMNQQMWAASVTQRNIQRLRDDGVTIVGPDAGVQACGENGPGRMLEAAQLCHLLTMPQPWRGKRIVVNTGATVERLDAMRVISNRSSGQMGFCLAAAAHALGADVTILAAQVTAPPPPGIALRHAVEGEDMRRAVLQEAATADWFFAVAAVADFRPTLPPTDKPARENGELTIKLSPTEDILAETAVAFPQLKCLGFSAHSGGGREKTAREKMKRKKVQWMVVNDTDDAGRKDCQLTLLYPGGKKKLPRMAKEQAARQLLDIIVSHETPSGDVSCETNRKEATE